MSAQRNVKLFRDETGQALHIPREFELPGDEAVIRKEGARLVIEPVKKKSLLELLDSLEPIEDEFPPIEELPLDDVEL